MTPKVFRLPDVPIHTQYWLRQPVQMVSLPDRKAWCTEPGIYVSTADTRTDAEIRASFVPRKP